MGGFFIMGGFPAFFMGGFPAFFMGGFPAIFMGGLGGFIAPFLGSFFNRRGRSGSSTDAKCPRSPGLESVNSCSAVVLAVMTAHTAKMNGKGSFIVLRLFLLLSLKKYDQTLLRKYNFQTRNKITSRLLKMFFEVPPRPNINGSRSCAPKRHAIACLALNNVGTQHMLLRILLPQPQFLI